MNKKRRKKTKNNNKKIINYILNISVVLLVICLLILVINKDNISSYYNNKKLLKQASALIEDKDNIYLIKNTYQENNKNCIFYLLLNNNKKELTTIDIKDEKEVKLNKIPLKKINKIANNDLIKLELNSSSRNLLYTYYINMNIEKNTFYFSFLDGTTYESAKNIELPQSLIRKILESGQFIKLLELTNNKENYDILFSELLRTVAIANKKNNKYISLNYLDPYISKNNKYNENFIQDLLKEYKKEYDPNVSLKIINNKTYNTRNAYSKYVTIISTENKNILNIRPAGYLYNVMFEPKFELNINKAIIK